jgi:hypothetical protein
MPLVNSASKKAVGTNISREVAAGKPHDQAVAIALSVQDKAKKRKNTIEASYAKHMKSSEEKTETKTMAKKESKKDEMAEY